MSRLTTRELKLALDALHAIGEASGGSADYAERGVRWLPQLVASELTTLSVCDLASGHRSVVGFPSGAIGPLQIEVFDHYFFAHPLVLEHGRNVQAETRRISDLMSGSAFRRTPLYADYYRPIGISHVVAVPVHVDQRFLVSFVLQRGGRPFSDHERDLLEVLRPHLVNLYRIGIALDRARENAGPVPAEDADPAWVAALPLTPREREVLQWVAAGKSNRDIAEILGASPRTVEKHLEHVFDKLGVETRTAAAMRAAALASTAGEAATESRP